MPKRLHKSRVIHVEGAVEGPVGSGIGNGAIVLGTNGVVEGETEVGGPGAIGLRVEQVFLKQLIVDVLNQLQYIHRKAYRIVLYIGKCMLRIVHAVNTCQCGLADCEDD